MDERSSRIPGVRFHVVSVYHDSRGWLTELFRSDEMPSVEVPLMAYCSATLPGKSRGPHEHRFQTDRFYFAGGCLIELFLWDNRAGSSYYGTHERHSINGSEQMVVVISPGIVHAYRNIGSETALILNFPNRLYRGVGKTDSVDEIRHEEHPDSPFRLPPLERQ